MKKRIYSKRQKQKNLNRAAKRRETMNVRQSLLSIANAAGD